MKNLYTIVNKKYDKPLLSWREEKAKYTNIKACLHMFQIPCDKTGDDDLIQYEIIYQSILVKQKFEEVFFDTYVKMFDYWYDLTYLERKQQMNVDICCLCEEVEHFSYKQEKIYMPCFEPSFNHLYSTEIVLLDLKQYHPYIKTFANEVRKNQYGVLPFHHGFSSCEVIAEHETAYVLYHPTCNRLYLYRDNAYVTCLSLDPKCSKEQEIGDRLRQLASFMILDDEQQMLDCIIESNLIKSKMKKRLLAYKAKRAKKKSK